MRPLIVVAIVAAIALRVYPADVPASQPATTTFFPADRALTYRVPAGWQTAGGNAASARYTVAGADATVSLSILPADTKMTPEFQQKLLDGFHDARLKAKGVTVINAPALEPDDRFSARIHERYTYQEAGKPARTSDDLLLYRAVGPRLVMLSLKMTGTNVDLNTATRKAAEDVLLSVGGDKSSPSATTAPATTAPATAAPATAALANGLITYTPPSGWQSGKTTPNSVSYVTAAHDGILAIQLLPVEVAMGPEAASAIVNQRKDALGKAKTKVLLGPLIEPDDRFALKIHERYEVGRKEGIVKIADQLHLYRAVGSRVVMLTVNTVADEAEAVKTIQKAAEDAILSATLHRPGEKKPAPAR